MIGATVGSYQLVRQIGEGGMGAVYLGTHSILGRPAAIKVLLPELSQRRDIVRRFFNEARAATAIRHPGIVEIYDFGFLANGSAYIAMEFLDGESLEARLGRQGRLSLEASIQVARQIAAALHQAHSKGIIHRDLKPDNIFLVPDPEIGERVKLLDFGIAKLATEDTGGTRTRTGTVLGTPAYMSPEQCRGASTVDGRSDLYSLGCILYKLIAGRPVFDVENAGDIIAHHLYFAPELVRKHEPSVPEPLEQLIQSLLGKDPAMRPATAGDVFVILDQWRAWASVPSYGAAWSATTMPAAHTRPGGFGAKMPTTLSGSTATVTVRPKSNRVLWFAGAVVLAAGMGIGIVMAVDTKPATSAATSAPTTTPLPPHVSPAQPAPSASPVGSPPPHVSPAQPAPSAPPVESPPRPPPVLDKDRTPPDKAVATITPPPKIAPVAKPRKPERAVTHATRAAAAGPSPASPDDLAETASPPPTPLSSTTKPPVDRNPEPELGGAAASPATTSPRVPTPIGPGSLDAVPTIATLEVKGSLSTSIVRRALDRVLRPLRECYRSAAKQASETPALDLTLRFEIDENAMVRHVTPSGTTSGRVWSGLASCIVSEAAKIRIDEPPDVGTVHVSVLVRFLPTGGP